jgi:glutaredoxin
MKHHTIALLLGSAALLGLAHSAQAQPVYRIVGPDGKVTFSDKPPANADQGKATTAGSGSAAAAPSAGLPFELRAIVAKYPVVLYTGAQCEPCDTGRSLLKSRGVPFTERTVVTQEDHVALQRLMGDTSLPYLTIGSQRVKGMSDLEWTQYLDAAGYPKASTLPASYRNPTATPLVAVQKAAPTDSKPVEKPPTATSSDSSTPNQPPATNSSNPAGITF